MKLGGIVVYDEDTHTFFASASNRVNLVTTLMVQALEEEIMPSI